MLHLRTMAGSKSSSMPGGTFRSGVPELLSRCVQEDSSRTRKAAARFRSTICRYLGGREYVRGYESYRFRGNNLLMFSTELRRTVYKKTDRRGVDVFGFADSGQVWGDARSSTDPRCLRIRISVRATGTREWEAVFNTDTLCSRRKT